MPVSCYWCLFFYIYKYNINSVQSNTQKKYIHDDVLKSINLLHDASYIYLIIIIQPIENWDVHTAQKR